MNANCATPNPVESGALDRVNSAKFLSISTRLLDKLASEGKIVRTKIGWKSVFLVEDLKSFLQSCRQEVSQ